jgi:four helix bundle protein
MRNDEGAERAGGDLQVRTRAYALEMIRFVRELPREMPAQVIGRQVLRAGTSVGANYRAACRARSQADFIAKLGIVEEEADECLYWLDLLAASGIVAEARVGELVREGNELLAMTVSSIRTAKTRRR